MTDTLCTETVNRGHGRWTNMQPCGRPAVEDGLCKLHLRMRDKQRAKSDEYTATMNRNRELQAEAERLSDALGFRVIAHYDWRQSRYTDRMVVPLDWIQKIAKEGANDARP